MTLPFRAMANEVGVIGFVGEAVQPFLASAESIADSRFDIACAGLLSSAPGRGSVLFERGDQQSITPRMTWTQAPEIATSVTTPPVFVTSMPMRLRRPISTPCSMVSDTVMSGSGSSETR